MSKEPPKLDVPKARLTMGAPSNTVRTTYRLSKAQSLKMRAHDARVEVAEMKKAKAAEKKQAKADKDFDGSLSGTGARDLSEGV